MAQGTVLAIAQALGQDIQTVGSYAANRLNFMATSPDNTAIQALHKAAGTLVYSIGSKATAKEQQIALDQLEGALQTAAVLGVLNMEELDGYLDRTDALGKLLGAE